MLSLSRVMGSIGPLAILLCVVADMLPSAKAHALHPAAGVAISRASTPALSLITEAPSAELVRHNLQKRAVVCSEWVAANGNGITCATGTCLFTTQSGRNFMYCGSPGAAPQLATTCVNYPIQPFNTVSLLSCPPNLPYCGQLAFSLQGATYYNLGCDTLPYNAIVVTKPGAVVPGFGASTSPSRSTTSSSPSPVPTTTSPVSTPVTTTRISTSSSSSPSSSSSSSPTSPLRPSSSSSSTLPIQSSSSSSPPPSGPSSRSTTTTSPASPPSSPPPQSFPSEASTSPFFASALPSYDSTIPSATSLPCNDASWDPTLPNWISAATDDELRKWWSSTASQRGSASFVDWLSRSFGDMSRSQQCGIGLLNTCTAPSCQAFQTAGSPRWAYFVRISVVNMNALFNVLKEAMQDAEADLALTLNNLATDFFPWQDPRTDLQKALPWIEAIVGLALAFIPFVGPELALLARIEEKYIEKYINLAVEASRSLVDAGFKTLQVGEAGYDLSTHQIGTVVQLGALLKRVLSGMRAGLEEWAKTLFDGATDQTGKTIVDYLVGGRFTHNIGVSLNFLAQAYYKIQIAKLVDGQWRDPNKPASRTFVMCTNSTAAPCNDASRYTENGRTCCLYSVNGDANYVTPPSLAKLTPLYNITAQDVSAGALHTYLAGGLGYDDAQINDRVRATISLNSSDSFLVQGVRFQGVWTIPVCDVGRQAGWVGNAADGMMPCCCGVNCAETEAAWAAIGIPRRGSAQGKCKAQCPSCPISSRGARAVEAASMGVVVGVAGLVVAWLAQVV